MHAPTTHATVTSPTPVTATATATTMMQHSHKSHVFPLVRRVVRRLSREVGWERSPGVKSKTDEIYRGDGGSTGELCVTTSAIEKCERGHECAAKCLQVQLMRTSRKKWTERARCPPASNWHPSWRGEQEERQRQPKNWRPYGGRHQSD